MTGCMSRDGELWVLFSISDGPLGTTLHSTEWIIFSKTIKTLELDAVSCGHLLALKVILSYDYNGIRQSSLIYCEE